MTTLFVLNLLTPKIASNLQDSTKGITLKPPCLNQPWKRVTSSSLEFKRMQAIRPVRATPDRLSEKVEQSIKEAQETCSEDPASGECVAAWDEVEELSAAASHARDRKKDEDPLENYCKDNPETKECKTFDD